VHNHKGNISLNPKQLKPAQQIIRVEIKFSNRYPTILMDKKEWCGDSMGLNGVGEGMYPGTIGYLEFCHSLRSWCKSEWQIPQYRILKVTSCAPAGLQSKGNTSAKLSNPPTNDERYCNKRRTVNFAETGEKERLAMRRTTHLRENLKGVRCPDTSLAA
jgi:hypothetical protein